MTSNSIRLFRTAQRRLMVAVVGAVFVAAPAACRPSKPSTHSAPPAPAPHVGGPTTAGARHGIDLKDVTAHSGITFVHNDGGSGKKYLIEAVSAGLALFDYDSDGLIDVYFLNGAPLPPLPDDPSIRNALYRNEGNFRFREVTESAGVGDTGFGLGVAVADYDNDGFPDVYVSNLERDVLYRSNGDGTFSDVTQQAGLAGYSRAGAGVAFLDIEGDGDLDLYVANYVRFTTEGHWVRTMNGFPSYPGPLDYQPEFHQLFRNEGDGTFTDISDESGIGSAAANGMGVVAADYDNDGDTDIFVVNDVMANFLFENDGRGKFTEVGVFRNVAYSLDGHPLGNMGVDCGDYDNDGWLDFFTTTYSSQLPTLYRNVRGSFADVTVQSGAAAGSLPHVNWGTGFADFDNDGDRDLFAACGHLDQNVHLWNSATSFGVRNLLLMNTGDGKFLNVSDNCGNGLAPALSSRGSGLDDLDNDGRIDIVVLNSGARSTIVRNESPASGHWLQVQLRGRQANRDGVGAQVRVTAGGRTQLIEVHSGRGYQSHHGTRLHFGLGTSPRVERVEVRWSGGGVDVLEDLPADQRLHITQQDAESR